MVTGMGTVLPVFQAWAPGGDDPVNHTGALNMLRQMMAVFDIPDPRVILHAGAPALINALAFVIPRTPTIYCNNKQEMKGPMTTSERTAYVSRCWWKYEGNILNARMNNFVHYFGVRDSSAVKNTRDRYKRWIKAADGDLPCVFRRLLPWWTMAARSTLETIRRSETIVPYQLRYREFAACVNVISNWALFKTDELWREATRAITNDEPRTACSGRFRVAHGRPCVHERTSASPS
ncbi:hypothetical protein P3T76_014156 [Phytophthora citrophthora]|uniref:Uncharacterized protein n=1 Tax=Phytophthora citrophthora TaxID=4793 RepID=A0AAD9LBL3_9STRA|nr:hypothetical protein P3T76_014156 [Phytophthora citrophthora]